MCDSDFGVFSRFWTEERCNRIFHHKFADKLEYAFCCLNVEKLETLIIEIQNYRCFPCRKEKHNMYINANLYLFSAKMTILELNIDINKLPLPYDPQKASIDHARNIIKDIQTLEGKYFELFKTFIKSDK